MKKLNSLLLAIAMMATIFTTVSFAADNEVVFTEKNKTSNSVDIEIAVKTSYADINGIQLYIDVSDAVGKNATITAAKSAANQFNFVPQQNMVAIVWKSMDTTRYSSNTVLGTITVTNISSDFSLKAKEGLAMATTKILSDSANDIVAGGALPLSSITSNITMVNEPDGPTEFSVNSDTKLSNFYTEDATVQRFECVTTGLSLVANDNWVFQFTSATAGAKDPVTVDMSTVTPNIQGSAEAKFEAWIIGAPDDVTLSVTAAQ